MGNTIIVGQDNRGIDPESRGIGPAERGLAPLPQGGYIRGNQFSEIPFSAIQRPEPRVTIEFEKKDLSRGTARFTNATHLTKNLALKPGGKPGVPPSLMVHGNVEVHFYDKEGREVPMTRRWVRYWRVEPKQGTTVMNRGSWDVYKPNGETFVYDSPSDEDVPGWQACYADSKPAGQIQEFLAGNDKIGGVYFNTWTLQDPDGTTRVMHFNKRKLTANEYKETLKKIWSADYAKKNGSALLFNDPFIPSSSDADTGVMLLPKKEKATDGKKNAQTPPKR